MGVKVPTIDIKATGENIKRLMKQNHYTISSLQVELRMANSTLIYCWTRGERLPNANHLLQLARVFGCHIDDILVEEGDFEEE